MPKDSFVTKLQNQGNNHALIIDSALIDQLDIDADTQLQLTVTDGSLIVRPVDSGAGRVQVADSLATIRNRPGYPEMLAKLAE